MQEITWVPHFNDFVTAAIVTMVITLTMTRIAYQSFYWTRSFISVGAVGAVLKAMTMFKAVHTATFIGITSPVDYLSAVGVVLISSIVLATMWAGTIGELLAMLFTLGLNSADGPKTKTGYDHLEEVGALMRSGKTAKAKRLALKLQRNNEASPGALATMIALMSPNQKANDGRLKLR